MSGQSALASGLAPRALTGVRPRCVRRAAWTGERVVFSLVLAAILSQLTVSANLLQWGGIPYDSPGGLPFVKFHVGTYLVFLAMLLQVLQRRPVMAHLAARIADAPHFAAAAALMLLCSLYTLASTGLSGSAIYIETYAAAAVLGFTLEQMGQARLRRIAYAMLAAFVANGLLCIVETMRQKLFIPIWLTNPDGFVSELEILVAEFRGTALYVNPLAGATMSMMGVFLCLACDLRPALRFAALAVLMVSLISFGGRTAMLVTYVVAGGLAGRALVGRMIRRRLSAAGLALAASAVVAVPALLAIVLFATPLGARISGKIYVDDSATVRVVQWLIFDRMELRDWLFGMDTDRLNAVMLQIGLDPPLNDIENFWLLVFVSLGVVGASLWLGGMAALLRRLWITPGPFARIILLSMLAVASGSNSLGRKSNLLFMCVGCVMSAAAFAPPVAASRFAPPAARPRFRTSPEIT